MLTTLLREELVDGLGFDQFAGLIEMVVNDGFRVDAEAVVNGCEDFGGMHGVFEGCGTGFVGFAVDVTTLDTGATDNRSVAIGPVVPSIIAVIVA